MIMDLFGESEVGQFEDIVGNKYVGWLDIPVDDSVFHEFFYSVEELLDYSDCLVLLHFLIRFDELAQVAVGTVLGDYIGVIGCVEHVYELDDVGVVEGLDNLNFLLQQLGRIVRRNVLLVDYLQCYQLVRVYVCAQVDYPVGSLADDRLQTERVVLNFLIVRIL